MNDCSYCEKLELGHLHFKTPLYKEHFLVQLYSAANDNYMNERIVKKTRNIHNGTCRQERLLHRLSHCYSHHTKPVTSLVRTGWLQAAVISHQPVQLAGVKSKIFPKVKAVAFPDGTQSTQKHTHTDMIWWCLLKILD